ncbi:MAG TPA: hypothetical protein DDW27_14725 [Bacteroidales bacterium]|nr:hypothetical protein [Bacteroidales bacterium]
MRRTKITHLICYDDHRTFTEDVRKRFSDPDKYLVELFHTKQEFSGHLRKITEAVYCKVAIVVIPDGSDTIDAIGKMTDEISKTDPKTGIILVVPSDKMEEVRKVIKFNIDAYITKNTNAILRIHNEVKKLISEHNINIYRKRRNLSFTILIAFMVLCLCALLIAYFRLPMYF